MENIKNLTNKKIKKKDKKNQYSQYLIYGLVTVLPVGYIYFNRNPDRDIPEGDNLVSPADGIIQKIENNKIEIFIQITDVHYQRSPFTGTITNISPTNQNTSYNNIELSTTFGSINIERWAGKLARTILTFVKSGEIVNKGEIIGRILLGSHCSVTVPTNMTIKVNVGDHLLAGETIIAE